MKLEFLTCRYCNRRNFSDQSALRRHQIQSPQCSAKLTEELQGRSKNYLMACDFTKTSTVAPTKTAKRVTRLEEEFARILVEDSVSWQKALAKRQKRVIIEEPVDTIDNSDDDQSFLFWAEEEIVEEEAETEAPRAPMQVMPDVYILGNYKKYAEYAQRFHIEFDKPTREAIELMLVLRQTKASLSTYDEVMTWHLRCRGKLLPHEPPSCSKLFISKERLFKQLRQRYNYDKDSIQIRPITLSHSKAKVNMVLHDVRKAIQSLLIDPRINDEDYLFFDNDPFKKPPDDLNYVADLNTGLCYTETYKKLITNPEKQILLPVVLYIDGAATGQFADLTITPLKMTIGILTRVARDRRYLWRTLGYVPKVPKGKSRGNRLLLQSGHCDGAMQYQDAYDSDGETDLVKVEKMQDLHDMLSIILEGFTKIQKTGFMWDFYYRGKLYEDVEFVPFVPFIKCDTDEADRLCGKYGCRTGTVKNICRYCECPTKFSDRCLLEFELKLKANIQALIEDIDMAGLKEISQKLIDNAMYALRFGSHNEMGIHGACPMEMLHAILLGIFRYIRDCFFKQLGETSKLAQDINSLSREYGLLMSRQSLRDMPKTSFSKGIYAGKIMAKEYTGILLVMAAVLQSRKGQYMLSKRKANFGKVCQLDDWILLIDTLLQWGEWLKSERMEKAHVEQAKKKHRYIMYLIKKVGRRVEGMGLKIMKFHGIMHMAMDILTFGVPKEYDTGSNESGHKPSKKASLLTQKRQDTFDPQLAKREEEMDLLELAEQEMLGRPIWEYSLGYSQPMKKEEIEPEPETGGAKFEIVDGEQTDTYVVTLHSKIANSDKMKVENELCKFFVNLQEKVRQYCGKLYLRTEHTRHGQIFRAHPYYRGRVWRDWVVVDWGEEGKLPNKIYGFIDLSGLPSNNGITHGGLDEIPPGMYAIVESANYYEGTTRHRASELFLPLRKEVARMENGFVTEMQFYLADVEAFVEPTVVIPDIGGPKNAYFQLKNRAAWKKNFIEWLEDDEEDEISDDEGCDEDEDRTNYNPDTDEDGSDDEGEEGEDDTDEDN